MALNTRSCTQTPTDGAVARVAIGAGVLATTGRGLHVTTAGNIVGQLTGETVDVTENFEVGMFPHNFKSITSATAVGFILL